MGRVLSAIVISGATETKLCIMWKNEDGSRRMKEYYSHPTADPYNPIDRISFREIVGMDEDELCDYVYKTKCRMNFEKAIDIVLDAKFK